MKIEDTSFPAAVLYRCRFECRHLIRPVERFNETPTVRDEPAARLTPSPYDGGAGGRKIYAVDPLGRPAPQKDSAPVEPPREPPPLAQTGTLGVYIDVLA